MNLTVLNTFYSQQNIRLVAQIDLEMVCFSGSTLSASESTQHLHAKSKGNAVIWNQLTIMANKQIDCSGRSTFDINQQ